MVNWRFWQRSPKPTVPSGSWAGETLKAKPKLEYQYHIMDRIYSWPQRCDEFDMYYNNHPEVKSMVLSIAGRATAKGVFLEPRSETGLAKEAADLCNAFNEEVGMDQLLYETIIPLVKYGTLLWEKTWSPDADLQLLPIVRDYKPLNYDHYKVNMWELTFNRVSLMPPLVFAPDGFAEFSWNRTATSFPFGTSLLVGLGQTLQITEQLLDDLQEYLHKAAFPGGLFQIGDSADRPDSTDLSSIQSKIRNWEPGENYVTSFVTDYKVVGPASAETRMLGEALDYLKDRLVDGVMVAPISKQNQRTMASADVMEDDTNLSIIQPVQRLLKRVLERQVYKPFLMDKGFSWKNVPKVSFYPPDENRDEQAAYYIPLVQANLITREAAARELGIEAVDIPSEEEVLKMRVVPPNGFGDAENPFKQGKAEEIIRVRIDYGEEALEDSDGSHSH